jgi:hypothetical protein
VSGGSHGTSCGRIVRAAAAALALVQVLVGCTLPSRHDTTAEREQTRAVLERHVPKSVEDRAGWIEDMDAVFSALRIEASPSNVCAVLAVAEQESGYRTDPVVPDLPAITMREIDRRADAAHVPKVLVRGVLALPSSTGESYRARLDRARTERELSAIFDDFVDRVPLGRRLFGELNPVHTRGPMQVHVAFAERYVEKRRYPFPADEGIGSVLFTRRGSLYFGTAHLLDYRAPYDRPLYRFADYNAGQYASRNAAFQQALAVASARTVVPDGALVPGDDDAGVGNTERAARALGGRLDLDDAAIRRDLERQRDEEFERTRVYRRVFEIADAKRGTPMPHAALPRIRIEGPKISRVLTNEWFAKRVDDRYRRCLDR